MTLIIVGIPAASAFGFAPRMLGRMVGKGIVLNSASFRTVAGGARAQASLSFGDKTRTDGFGSAVLVGKKALLLRNTPRGPFAEVDKNIYKAVVNSMPDEGSESAWLPAGGVDNAPLKLTFATLPANTTRNNHVLSPHALTSAVEAHCKGKKSSTKLTVVLEDAGHAPAAASAVAKGLPLYSAKTGDAVPQAQDVCCSFIVDGQTDEVSDAVMLKAAQAVADGVRLACSLVDRPPMDMTPTALADAAKAVAVEIPGVVVSEHIVGENLRDKGYGGIWGVGKAGECPPSLLVLSYDPPGAIETVCLVGKGITYDTGGLSLKSKDGMPGMKHDMGGAAGMIGGFYAAAKLGCKQRIHLILCIAENAIGPTAFRNDDILTMFSGKTVEVNNCDAEGRLVLGDGVAHATKLLRPNLVIDMATLTGAQLVATGKKHAGVLANSEELERKAVAAGLRSGDFCFPLLYAPELLFPEFKSEVADMKNSVKDRGNAQSSCAGHFIEKHLAADYTGGWLHIDMAGPGTKDQRATGYGVGLVLALLDAPGFS